MTPSLYGRWIARHGSPAFVYELAQDAEPAAEWDPTTSPRTRRNMHAHAQPLLAYLRLCGVEPTSRGTLAVDGGADFRSRVLRLDASGHGRLRTLGRVTVETRAGTVVGARRRVSW
jgi:hypothetical protein